MVYRVPPRRRSLDPLEHTTTTNGASDGPAALVLAGVIVVLAVQGWASYSILTGALDTVLQEQSTSAFASMLTLGSIAVFILPGILLQLRQIGRRR